MKEASEGGARLLLAIAGISLLIPACRHRGAAVASTQAERIGAAMGRAGVPGLALATLADCRVDSIQAFGLASVEAGQPITASTLFESASLSKPVLAYVFLRLVEQGTLSLDDPLAPAFDYPRASHASEYAMLTPRHILTHRSGLPNWAPRDPRTGARAPLRFRSRPGEAFTYSGEGFQLLQAYMESRTGASYESLFAAALAQDMPLSAFGFTVPAGTVVASAYRSDGSLASKRPLTDHDALSLRTTVSDYARFAERICSGDGLGRATWNEMLRPQSPAPLPAWRQLLAPVHGQVSWGLGWGVLESEGRTLHFHWGDNGAFKSMVVLERASGKGFVYFSNGEAGLDLLETVGDPIIGTRLQPIRRWVH